MNPELLKQIELYSINNTSNKNVIRSFLNGCISSNLYEPSV